MTSKSVHGARQDVIHLARDLLATAIWVLNDQLHQAQAA